jgi:hypothetical protein
MNLPLSKARNTFIAVALNEPEKDLIIRLTEGCDLVAPEVLPFEIGNAATYQYKIRLKNRHRI